MFDARGLAKWGVGCRGRQRALLELLLTFLVFGDDARIADGANAVIVAFSDLFLGTGDMSLD